MKRLRYVLVGDGQSPHLLKWARALAPQVELWAASSRGFLPEFDDLIAPEHRYTMNTDPAQGGGNIGLLLRLPGLAQWLRRVDADWLHAHYLTSHGTLAWAAKRGWRLRAKIVGSAWGSDILVTPQQGRAYRWLTRQVLAACTLCTSDSRHMTARMQALGAGEVMTFPFGLESMPPDAGPKPPWSFFANRGLEPIYRPSLVLAAFAAVAARQPEARLVMANEGSLRETLREQAQTLGLRDKVSFVGRLDAETQSGHYAQARWYFSLPESDSVAVSVLEAMAHGCVPLLSELPANHELLDDADGLQRGVIFDPTEPPALQALPAQLEAMAPQAELAAAANRAWVAEYGLFAPAVQRFLARLAELDIENKKA